MEARLVDSVTQEIYRRFPDFSGVSPKLKKYSEKQFLLIFEKKVQLADGKPLQKIIRVVADEKGKIKKVTASR